MQSVSLQYQIHPASGKLAYHDSGCDLYSNLKLSVYGVKVRWRVVTVIHVDGDSEKPAQLRHRPYISPGVSLPLQFR